MNREQAELVNIALLQINRQLKAVFEYVANEDPESIEEFKHRFAKVLGSHIMVLQSPLWDEFPDLKPEYVDGELKLDKSIFNPSPFGEEYTYPDECS